MEEKQIMILGILWQIIKNVVLGQINLKQFPELFSYQMKENNYQFYKNNLKKIYY